MNALLDSVRFDDKGLVPAIVQDHATKQVLMFAWMNRESLQITLTEGKACYWSRSRQKLWRKGESSGHTQKVHELRVDCDNDCLLISVTQEGGACHTGNRSCFYRVADTSKPDEADWRDDGEVVFDPSTVYA